LSEEKDETATTKKEGKREGDRALEILVLSVKCKEENERENPKRK